MPAVVNRAEIAADEIAEGDIAFARRRLAAAAGSERIGASLYEVPAGARQMPVHVHGDEEEIFFVVSGAGLSWERGEGHPVWAGDTIVHRPGGAPHTFLADEERPLELLAFASGSETSLTFLPRAGVMWAGPQWVPLDAPHPFRAEADAGPLERPAVAPAVPPAPGDPLAPPPARPPHIVALADVDSGPFPPVEIRAVGRAAGAVKAGLNHVTLPPGAAGAPAHCHALEEELFVVLDGAGTLTLGADPARPLRAGDIVARPPGTGIAHALTAGPDGLVYLAYGTREPGDTAYYPELGQVRLRGLGVTLDVPAR